MSTWNSQRKKFKKKKKHEEILCVEKGMDTEI